MAWPTLRQVLAIGSDDLFIPAKALFPVAAASAGAVVVLVNVDKAIPLLQFAGGSAQGLP